MASFFTKQRWILLVMVSYALLSSFFVARYDIWRDEAFSIHVAQQPVAQLVAIVSRDVHPPLHLLLLKGWMTIFGSSVQSVRSLSIGLGMLTIYLAHQLAKLVFSKTYHQRWSTVLVATSPFLLFYGLEARVYTLLMASLVGAVYTTLLAFHANTKNKYQNRLVDAGFVLSVLTGLYGHVIFLFTMVGVVAWQGLVLLTRLMRKQLQSKPARQVLFRFLANYLIIGLLFLPWLTALWFQIQQVGEQGFWLQFNPVVDLVTSFDQFFITNKVSTEFGLLAPLFLYLLSTLGFGYFFAGLLTGPKKDWLAWLVPLTLAPVFIASFATPIYYIRYITLVVPLVAISMAIGVSTIEKSIGKRVATGIIGLLAVLQLYAFAGNSMQLPGIKAEYQQAISSIQAQYPTATIIHPHGYTLHSFRYYGQRLGFEPGKLYDPDRNLPHFEGLAAYTDYDYYPQPLGTDSLIVTPYLYVDTGFEEKLRAVGYQLLDQKQFAGGLEYKVWQLADR